MAFQKTDDCSRMLAAPVADGRPFGSHDRAQLVQLHQNARQNPSEVQRLGFVRRADRKDIGVQRTQKADGREVQDIRELVRYVRVVVFARCVCVFVCVWYVLTCCYERFADRRQAAPRFVIKPQSAFSYEGQSVKFHCRVIAVAQPTLSWFHNNDELKQSVKFMKRYAGDDYTFIINRAKLDDRGEYVIRAENTYGYREEVVFLNVQRTYARRFP